MKFGSFSQLVRAFTWLFIFVCILPVVSYVGRAADRPLEMLARSEDAFIGRSDKTWTFGTSKVQKKVEILQGHLSLESFKNLITNHEYVEGTSDVFEFGLDGHKVTGRSENWSLESAETEKVDQGELLLKLRVRDDTVEVSKITSFTQMRASFRSG